MCDVMRPRTIRRASPKLAALASYLPLRICLCNHDDHFHTLLVLSAHAAAFRDTGAAALGRLRSPAAGVYLASTLVRRQVAVYKHEYGR